MRYIRQNAKAIAALIGTIATVLTQVEVGNPLATACATILTAVATYLVSNTTSNGA